uniref:Uncharacterized protein n=1 Tax=Cucumis melo TaxID=3656 RepID=A0A9I9EEV7_CUCME
MALQRVKTLFDGRWIESSRYIDYRVLDVYVPVSSLFQEFVNCIQRTYMAEEADDEGQFNTNE